MGKVKIRCFVESDIHQAEQGDIETAKFLIQCVADCLKNNIQPPKPLRDYMSSCLGEIARGSDPASALNIKSKPGRVCGENRSRDVQIVLAIRNLRRNGYTLRGNNNQEGAFSVVGREFHKSSHTIEEIYKRWRNIVEQIENDLLAAGIPPEEFGEHIK